MIKNIFAAFTALYVSSCGLRSIAVHTASPATVDSKNTEVYSRTHIQFTNQKIVATYAASMSDDTINAVRNGFKIGMKSTFGIYQIHEFRNPDSNKWTQELLDISDRVVSAELSFRALFNELGNSYDLGIVNGISCVRNYDHNLEILLAPARIGISSDRSYWSPQVGLGYEYKLFQLQMGGDFYVNKEKRAGIFVNGGLAF